MYYDLIATATPLDDGVSVETRRRGTTKHTERDHKNFLDDVLDALGDFTGVVRIVEVERLEPD